MISLRASLEECAAGNINHRPVTSPERIEGAQVIMKYIDYEKKYFNGWIFKFKFVEVKKSLLYQ